MGKETASGHFRCVKGDADSLAVGQAEEVVLTAPRWELHVHLRRRSRHPWKGQDRKGGPRASVTS